MSKRKGQSPRLQAMADAERTSLPEGERPLHGMGKLSCTAQHTTVPTAANPQVINRKVFSEQIRRKIER